MKSTRDSDHRERNQKNYSKKAEEHDTLGLNSTMYLAYRDVNTLLEKHLYPKIKGGKIRLLDFGCGVGLSTEVVSKIIREKTEYEVDSLGVDINEANLDIAKDKVPDARFECITSGVELKEFGKFDLIVCNFVLLEMPEKEMREQLCLLSSLLEKDGILIVTNTTAKVYRQKNNWYTLNNKFQENKPEDALEKDGKLKFPEDYKVKLQCFAAKDSDQSFTFFDYFHSGSAYRKAYVSAGLELLQTHKPLGTSDDQLEWVDESQKSPYKIHVLGGGD